MQSSYAGADGFGDPERAHRLVYRIHENQWERTETMVLSPPTCATLSPVWSCSRRALDAPRANTC